MKTLKVLAKIYCFLFKHDFVEEGKFDNGRSKYGIYKCTRCGYNHDWQYDYN